MTTIDGKSPNLAHETTATIHDLLMEPAIRDRLAQICPDAFCDGDLQMDLLLEAMGKYHTTEDIKELVVDENERYEFRWSGKQKAKYESQKSSTGTLRPCPEESKNWDTTQNLYIEGDNLEVLKILKRAYAGKIKMIYIDPPYNTGKDFVYKDDYTDNLKNYLEQTGQLTADGKAKSSNTANDGRFHTNWLNMMYPRLRLARELLSDDGVIFISIDDNEQANLKKLCDEVFGVDNFVGMWSWYKSATPPNLSCKIKKNLEYIYAYERIKNGNKYKGILKTSVSNNGLMNQTNSVHTLNFPANTIETNLKNGIYSRGLYGTENYKIELLNDAVVKNGVFVTNVVLNGKFKWGQDYLNEELKKGTVISIKSIAFSPSYEKKEYDPEVPPNFINNVVGANTTEEAGKYLDDIFNGVKVFDYPKDTGLLKYILSFNRKDNNDDIILDFFSGTATTAHAVMQLNAEDNGKRQYIMVQLPENIQPVKDKKGNIISGDTNNNAIAFLDTIHRPHNLCEIGKERIRRAGEKVVRDQLSGIRDEIKAKYGCIEVDEELCHHIDTAFFDRSNLNESEALSGLSCLAEGDGGSKAHISCGQKTSKGRDLFDFRPDAKSSSVDSIKYSGGAREELNKGVSAFSEHSKRLEGRAANSTNDLRSSWIPCRYGHFGADKQTGRSGKNDTCPFKGTDNCPLTTELSIDVGFKVFKLSESNMNKWHLELAELKDKNEMEKAAIAALRAGKNTIRRKEIEAENAKRKAAGLAPFDIDLCVIYEWLLKYGVMPDCRITTAQIGGHKVYSVSGGAFMICLEHGLNRDWAQALVVYRDECLSGMDDATKSDAWHVMVADECFDDTRDMQNVAKTLHDAGLKEEHWIVV